MISVAGYVSKTVEDNRYIIYILFIVNYNK